MGHHQNSIGSKYAASWAEVFRLLYMEVFSCVVLEFIVRGYYEDGGMYPELDLGGGGGGAIMRKQARTQDGIHKGGGLF